MNLWDNNELQFARLIWELNAVGAFTQPVMDGLSFSMDLEKAEIHTLIARAEKVFEDATGVVS